MLKLNPNLMRIPTGIMYHKKKILETKYYF